MICVGHSQMVCVLQAAQDEQIPLQAVVLRKPKRGDQAATLDRTRLLIDPAKTDFGAETKELLARTEGPVVSFIGGIKHISMGLRQVRRTPPDPPYDFVLAQEPDLGLNERAELIPYGAVRDLLARRTKRYHQILERIAWLTDAPVYQVESSPPPADSWMENWMNAQQRKKDRLGFHDLELPPRLLRYKLWRLNSLLVREHADKIGVKFVERPPEAVDAEGFLRDELVRNYTHANAGYGALVLTQLTAL